MIRGRLDRIGDNDLRSRGAAFVQRSWNDTWPRSTFLEMVRAHGRTSKQLKILDCNCFSLLANYFARVAWDEWRGGGLVAGEAAAAANSPNPAGQRPASPAGIPIGLSSMKNLEPSRRAICNSYNDPGACPRLPPARLQEFEICGPLKMEGPKSRSFFRVGFIPHLRPRPGPFALASYLLARFLPITITTGS